MNVSLSLTRHAQVRMQQRRIPPRVLDWLADYGEVNHQRGAELYYFSQRSRKALVRDLGSKALQHHEKALNAYMVCTDGQVTTVGHRYQRVNRH